MKETKHRSTRWALGVWALVLAAALLLAGCGGAAAPAAPAGPSAAANQSSDNSRSTPGAAALAAQTDRITDQYTLEKNVSGVWGEDAVQYISVHVPKLECDSPDAAHINDELNAIYGADFREFESSEEAGQPGGEYPQIGVGWDAYWYGDCVSLVVHSRYDGTAPWRYIGWCFDFASGRQLTVAELLQRMGLDPDEVQTQVQRKAMQAFDREMAQGAYYEGLRLGGELSQMRMDTLEDTALENLCLLLPEQDQLVLRGKYYVEEGLAATGCGDPADLRRPRRHPGADRYLRRCAGAAKGNAGHHHPEPCTQRPTTWDDGTQPPAGTGAHLSHPWLL